MTSDSLTLVALPDTFAVCRLDPTAAIPEWAMRGSFYAVTRTADELSIVCREADAPRVNVTCERGWRAFKLEGTFDFGQIGVLASIANALAEARVSIFALSTYDTDYVLVKGLQFEQAVTALTRFGHIVKTSTAGASEAGEAGEASQASQAIAIHCAWRLPTDVRVRATFDAEVIEYDAKQDRWLVKLTGVPAMPAMPAMSEALDASTRALIESQIGKWAYVPSEARRGLTLPLKYETLTGQIKYFYADDPRLQKKQPQTDTNQRR